VWIFLSIFDLSIKQTAMRFLTESDYITNESLGSSLAGEFSMFYVSFGRKYFITKLYRENLGFNEATSTKMSDPKVLKVNEAFGRKVLSKMSSSTVRGLVDKNGYQILCN
jgi:hypothetical protein